MRGMEERSVCGELTPGPGYFWVCTIGGMLSAGTTHVVITPLDVLKVNMQICFTIDGRFYCSTSFGFLEDFMMCSCNYLHRYEKLGPSPLWNWVKRGGIAVPVLLACNGFCDLSEYNVYPIKYKTISSCFLTLLREQGPSAFWRGWGTKFFGYGVQGGFRFGLYEYFKKFYSNVLVDYNRSFIFFASSASAEVFANVALCPFEAVKVRVQAQPHFAKGLLDGFPKLYASEGLYGFYRGLVPLWGRNLPFSMIMFSTFEHSVDFLYRNVIHRRKEDCSTVQQLGVSCLAGCAAGSVASLITNPADNIVASLYNRKADSLLLAVKKIGLLNLFTRSLPIRIILVGPVVTLQWLFYDSIKVLSGLPTSGQVLDKEVNEKI